MISKVSLSHISERFHFDKPLAFLYVNLLYPDKSLIPNINSHAHPAINRNNLVLFPLLGGVRTSEMTLDALISHALNLRGISSRFILCDRKFPICINSTVGNIENCHYCYYLGRNFASRLNIPVSWVGEYLSDEQINNAQKLVSSLSTEQYRNFTYKDVEIGPYAEAATIRFLKTGLVENKDFDINISGKYLISAILQVELSERINKEIKPSHLITSNAAYLPGVFVEYFSKIGIKNIICDFGLLKDSIILNHVNNKRKDLLDISSETWGRYSARTLSNKQEQELQDLLFLRAHGKGMRVDHGQFARLESKEEIRKLLNLFKCKNIGVLFTNLPWDASMIGVDLVFNNPFEWVAETIEWFIQRKDEILVIKVHPAESIFGTRLSFLSFINSKFTELPDNIKILPPRSEVNTYGLMALANYGILYTSTSGLEMAIQGKPVITVAHTHYRGKGFTFDTNDKKEYFDLLEQSASLVMTPNMTDLANIYGYLHFCAREIPFIFIKSGKGRYPSYKLNLKDWRELLPGANESMDLICDGIIRDKEFFR